MDPSRRQLRRALQRLRRRGAEKVINLRGLSPPPGTPDPDVVADLEKLLERAKKGEIRAISWAMMRADGLAATGWVGPGASTIELAGAIAILQQRFIGAAIERRGPD